MSDLDAVDLGLAILRCSVGAIMLAHGINHIFGGGRIEGTAGWFESLGMKPGILHAWMASITEVVCGALLVLGLFTPIGAAGVVGTMVVAWITNHRGNGFFIFRPGEGWEYVMLLVMCGVSIGALGAGGWSLDSAFDIEDTFSGAGGLAMAAGLGGLGALGLLVGFWRPPAPESSGD